MSASQNNTGEGQTLSVANPDRKSEENRTDEQEDISRDDVFEILSNRRRRFTLHHLQQNGNRADLGELSEHVAAWENDTDIEAISSAERKRAYTSLQQFHLPKMDEKDVVEFDDREGVVELTASAENLDLYLEVVEDQDIPWSQYYLGLAVVNLGLLGGALLGFPGLSAVPAVGWCVFVATTFLVSSAIHTYYSWAEMRIGSEETPPEVKE